MGRKRRTDNDGCYVSNKELRELVIRYNDINPNDHGEWIPKYEKTMKTKGKLDEVKDWLEMRKLKYATRGHNVTPEFASVSSKLFNAVYKIARGRVACFQFNPEEKDDLIQEVMIAVLKYINRYREDMESSAFSYITSICNNAIKLYLGTDNDSRFCRLPWNTLSNDHIAAMYGVDDKEDLE